MNKRLHIACAVLIMATMGMIGTGSQALAACAFKNTVPVSLLANSFPAWKVVSDAMSECGSFTAELDNAFQDKHKAAFESNPSLYSIGGISNSSIVALLDANLVLPLDDLVKKYGQNLQPNQLIKVDGKTVAIAMLVNAQHLMYRKDIFDTLGLSEPKDYEELLKVAEAIKKSGLVEYPLGATYKTGWNLAQDFVNMFLGFDGKPFQKNGYPSINSDAGVKALKMMKKLTQYMDPEFLVADSTYVQKQFQQGKIAVANLWATRAAAMDDEKESTVVGKVHMAQAPAAYPGGKPASTMWWDGLVIAKNIPAETAAAAFKVAVEGLDTETVKKNNDVAAWIIKGYQPTAYAIGIIETEQAGTPLYPSSTNMGKLHTALGENLSDFFTGKETAQQALADTEGAYITAAKEAGLIK